MPNFKAATTTELLTIIKHDKDCPLRYLVAISAVLSERKRKVFKRNPNIKYVESR